MGSRDADGTLQPCRHREPDCGARVPADRLADPGAACTTGLRSLWLGVFQIGLAYAAARSGVRHVTALEASLLLLAEPVLNPVWAWMVQGERPGRVGARRRRADSGGDGGADDPGSRLIVRLLALRGRIGPRPTPLEVAPSR